jgi:hypothetical protein
MADEAPQPAVDFWSVLEDAKATVEQWPSWQQQYDADIYFEEDSSPPEQG